MQTHFSQNLDLTRFFKVETNLNERTNQTLKKIFQTNERLCTFVINEKKRVRQIE